MVVGSVEFHAGNTSDLTSSRRRLADRLNVWGCGDAEAVLLVFSELATNALVHADGALHVAIEHRAGSTTVTVHDNSPQPPHIQGQDEEPGGYGLRIVDRLATDWGWIPTATGKQVWAAIDCCPER
jgi:two-component sensor histidine kinase